MKSLTSICMLIATLMLTGCQYFQFVDNPIPVKPVPTNLVAP
ncbi:hypothetical protein [Psychrobacter piscatorii]